MSSLTSLPSVASVVAQRPPNPDDVVAGWLGLVVFVGLAVAVVFLWLSLRKHLGRVNFDEGDDAENGDATPKRGKPRNGTPPSAPHQPQA